MAAVSTFLFPVIENVIAYVVGHYVCKWLDGKS